jgi:hypothetical protein
MRPFRKYTVNRYDIFRGKTNADIWYVYDTTEERYIGGHFSSLKDAKIYVGGLLKKEED